MSLPSLFEGLSEVRGALTADLRGELLEATGPEVEGRQAAATASAVSELGTAGAAVGLSHLEMLLVKGASQATLTAVGPDAFLVALLDPSKPAARVEKALRAWASARSARLPPRDAAPAAVAGAAPSEANTAATPPPVWPLPTQSPSVTGAQPDPWAALRRSLVRGQLTEAAARRRELGETSPIAGRAGAEPVTAAERDRAMQVLLDGIGSVLAGDGVGGGRALEELVAPAQPNLSLRWIALYWSAWAALRSGQFNAARQHAKGALVLSQQLDVDARAVSQWIAAEVLAHEGDHVRAMAWLGESRKRFERLGDRWGIAQTWLAEARILVSLQREEQGVAAARQAASADPTWDEAPIFLARRALLRGDLAGAGDILRSVNGAAVERAQALVDAIREGTVSHADASDFLRECDAPPTERSIRALERIVGSAPRFAQARESLAWMLLKVGKYAEASDIFRGLLAEQVGPAERASVMLGLGCIAHAQRTGKWPAPTLQDTAMPGGADPLAAAGSEPQRPAPLSTTSPPARSSQVASSAVFSGQLSVFAFPDVLEFLRSARRTGLLVCSSTKGLASLRFRDGWIAGVAASPVTPGLGEVLLRARKVSSMALRALGADHSDDLLGELLVKEGLVDSEAVQAAIRHQIEVTIRELVQWQDGEFAFNREAGGEPQSSALPVKVDAQAALLNVFKQMDEASRTPGPAVDR